MNKLLTLSFAAVLVTSACSRYQLPPNVVREAFESAVLYRDTTVRGAQAVYIARKAELSETPRRIDLLLKNGYRVVLEGREPLPSLVSRLSQREDVRPGSILLSTKDSTWAEGLGGVVIWEPRPTEYIQAHGGEKPVLRLSNAARPETFLDLAERLVLEQLPLEISATLGDGKGTVTEAPLRRSWGDVIMETFDFAVKDGDTLRLDVYRQENCDGPRPIILYSFGGGWQKGTRTDMDNPLFPFYTPMARMGYVVVAIDYRLGYASAVERGDVPPGDVVGMMDYAAGTPLFDRVMDACLRACLEATEDLFDATSYVVKHAAEWGGNPSWIVLCGGSAGACNSIMAEYLLANGAPLAQEHLPQGFRYGGVIPCAGALLTREEPVEWKRTPSPFFFLHGTADPIVPYGKGPRFEGPSALVPTLPEGTPYVLYTVHAADHVISGLPTGYLNHAIAAFIERYVVEGERAALSVEDVLTRTDEPLVKQYLLSGYHYSKEEVVRYYQMIYGPVTE